MNEIQRLIRSCWKHHKEFLVSMIVTFSLFAVAYHQGVISERNIESQNDAHFRAQQYNSQGGNAQPFRNPDGTYSDQFPVSLHDTATSKDCLSYVLVKANGTVISSPPC
jgi:hypothetical protein